MIGGGVGGEYEHSNKAIGMLFCSPSSLVGFVSSVMPESEMMKDCGGDKNLSFRAGGGGARQEARFTSDLSGEDLLLGLLIVAGTVSDTSDGIS
jgi:hypothetical protein